MKSRFWSILIILAVGCIPKSKYEAEMANIEGVYTRIDGITGGMNQMGMEINRLKEIQRDNKAENEETIRKLRIDDLKASDVTEEIAEMNTAMEAYKLHHAKGAIVRDNLGQLKKKAKDALKNDKISFAVVEGRVGFDLDTSIFAPANSPKIDEKSISAVASLVTALNEWEVEFTERQLGLDSEVRFDLSSGKMVSVKERTRYIIVARVDPSMPTGKRYESVTDLGLARALAVLNLLVEAGVKASRLAAAVKVAENPIPTEASKEERAHGRRIEIRVIRSLEGHPGFETLDAIERGSLRL
jgi:flagellar motor protein MotB